MHVLVTGATGFVGSKLVHELIKGGHAVSAVSRNAGSAKRRLPGLAAAHDWSPLAEDLPDAALAGVDAVVNLAGESVAGLWTSAKKQAIYDSRVATTQKLVDAFERVQSPRVFVSSSAIGYYGDRGEERLPETAAPGDDFLARVCRDWESAAEGAERLGVRVVRVRTSLVMGGGPPLETMLLPFKLGLGGKLGNGRQWWSWIHRDDLVRLMIFSLEQEVSGAVNGAAPEAARQEAFAKTLAGLLNRPAFLPAPAFALKLLLRGFAAELLGSKLVVPARAEAAGFTFRHPRLEGALRAALEEM